MAKKLTEEMVIARAKTSDLSKIKRLNCWGSELVEVSILRRMPSVEVLSLSINKIDSLEDFQYCRKLEELYIRQNNIQDLNQVCYLQDLPNLKNLWLGENPCANVEGYRLAVLSVLPQLQKLDNIPVTPEELRKAQQHGRLLSHPEDPEYDDREVYTPTYGDCTYYNEPKYAAENSPRRQEEEYELEEGEELSTNTELRTDDPPSPYLGERSPPYSNNNEEITHSSSCRDLRMVTSHSTNSLKEYVNGERYSHHNTRQSDDVITCQTDIPPPKQEKHTCAAASYRPPFHRRPMTRNSNILSAVLCLVKELDYPSLEVVEMAVRCRMDEIDE